MIHSFNNLFSFVHSLIQFSGLGWSRHWAGLEEMCGFRRPDQANNMRVPGCSVTVTVEDEVTEAPGLGGGDISAEA